MKPDFGNDQAIGILCAQQGDQCQDCGEKLGRNGGNGSSGNAHVEDGDK